MATVIRPELSEKNKYWINKHRHYELKHFCLQYYTWKKMYSELDGFNPGSKETVYSKVSTPSDPTANCVELKTAYLDRMDLVRRTAYEADPDLASYIFKAVTEDLSYTYLKARLNIPCGRDMYYDRYRKFFWLLSKARN